MRIPHSAWRTVARAALPLALAGWMGCASRPAEQAAVPAPAGTTAPAEAPAGATTPPLASPASAGGAVPDSLAPPMVISLRRDSLALRPGAPDSTVRAAVDSAIATLRRVQPFDVVAITAPLLAIKIKPPVGVASSAVIAALRHHRLVAAIEIDGISTGNGALRRP